MEWIDVKPGESGLSALPMGYKTVRVKAINLKPQNWQTSAPDGEYDGFFDFDDMTWHCYTGARDSMHLYDCTVTHWQELPAPPAGERKA